MGGPCRVEFFLLVWWGRGVGGPCRVECTCIHCFLPTTSTTIKPTTDFVVLLHGTPIASAATSSSRCRSCAVTTASSCATSKWA